MSAALAADARSMPFPIRRPATPDGWKPNSGSTQTVGGQVSSNVGWVTKKGSYVQLTDRRPEEELVATLGGYDAMGAGKREAGGHSWVVYDGENKNRFWIADLGDVRIGVRSKDRKPISSRSRKPSWRRTRCPSLSPDGLFVRSQSLSMRCRAPARCSWQRAASASPRSQRASEASRPESAAFEQRDHLDEFVAGRFVAEFGHWGALVARSLLSLGVNSRRFDDCWGRTVGDPYPDSCAFGQIGHRRHRVRVVGVEPLYHRIAAGQGLCGAQGAQSCGQMFDAALFAVDGAADVAAQG